MRLIGMVLALGVIVWGMVQASGGSQSESVISQGQQQALEKAHSLESKLQTATEHNLQGFLQDDFANDPTE